MYSNNSNKNSEESVYDLARLERARKKFNEEMAIEKRREEKKKEEKRKRKEECCIIL